jgi:hypothetical protein
MPHRLLKLAEAFAQSGYILGEVGPDVDARRDDNPLDVTRRNEGTIRRAPLHE